MKRILKGCTWVCGCVLGGLTLASAAPFERSDVIKEPLWVLNVDADALRATVTGQYLLAEMMKPEAQKKFEAFQAIFSFDPRKELHGVTLYDATKDESDGVLLVYADFDAARLTTLAEGARDHQSTTYGKYTIHNWIDDNKKPRKGIKPRTYAAIHGKVVIFAQKESRVAEALDVLDRSRPSLATNAQFAKLDTGSAVITGAARKLDLPGSDPSAAVFRQARMVLLNVGETDRQVQATLTLETQSDEVARSIETVGKGLIALMSLQKGKPEAHRIAQGLGLDQAGADVTVKLTLPADDVIEMLKAAEAKKQAAKQKE